MTDKYIIRRDRIVRLADGQGDGSEWFVAQINLIRTRALRELGLTTGTTHGLATDVVEICDAATLRLEVFDG